MKSAIQVSLGRSVALCVGGLSKIGRISKFFVKPPKGLWFNRFVNMNFAQPEQKPYSHALSVKVKAIYEFQNFWRRLVKLCSP